MLRPGDFGVESAERGILNVSAKEAAMSPQTSGSFILLIYRMPPKPTAARVAVWRQLNKLGLVYLQQMVGALPSREDLKAELRPILERIVDAGGTYHLLPLGSLPADERAKLVTQFRDQTSRHYQEIVENCEVNFVKEIEFETFRKNFTYEEAEEIRTEFEKIVMWFERVRARDWFGAPKQRAARAWLSRCKSMLEQFEARVYVVHQQSSAGAPRSRVSDGKAPAAGVAGRSPQRRLRRQGFNGGHPANQLRSDTLRLKSPPIKSGR
jgi:hypothetical protein